MALLNDVMVGTERVLSTPVSFFLTLLLFKVGESAHIFSPH